MKKLSVTLRPSEKILGFIYLAIEILLLQSCIWMVNLFLGEPMSEAQLNFLYFFVNFLFTTLIFHRLLMDCGKIALAAPLRCLSTAFTGFVLNWAANIAVSMVITGFFPDFYNVNDDSISGLVQDNYVLMSIGTVLLAPVAEELLFRGLVFGSLYNRNRWLAYTVSVVGFACLHVVGYIGLYPPVHLLLCFVQYIPAALILCWVYARSNTIWAPILLHIAVNEIAILSMR